MQHIYLSDTEAPAYELEHAAAEAERLRRVPVIQLDYAAEDREEETSEPFEGAGWLIIKIAAALAATLLVWNVAPTIIHWLRALP